MGGGGLRHPASKWSNVRACGGTHDVPARVGQGRVAVHHRDWSRRGHHGVEPIPPQACGRGMWVRPNRHASAADEVVCAPRGWCGGWDGE